MVMLANLQQRFSSNYSVISYISSLGIIPRSGIAFDCDTCEPGISQMLTWIWLRLGKWDRSKCSLVKSVKSNEFGCDRLLYFLGCIFFIMEGPVGAKKQHALFHMLFFRCRSCQISGLFHGLHLWLVLFMNIHDINALRLDPWEKTWKCLRGLISRDCCSSSPPGPLLT